MMAVWLRPVALLMAVAALSGCRAEEQGRVTSFEKGVYLGPEDEKIDEETRERLRERTRLQNFSR